ncbi:MAG: hypothetical protein HQK59_05990 [Deltaproteobacteria bacterium]|nr:hypothetical protein [Deltaproteobacteria bacterium]
MQKAMPLQKLFYALVASTLLLFVFGCSHVRLIAEYDENIDQGITALQKKTEDHLSKLEIKMARIALLKDGSEEKESLKKEVSYPASEEFYRQFRVDLRVLQSRAESYAGNDLTVGQMKALDEILKAQEEIQKRGFQTVDDVTDMRTAFTRGFKGILKLEIAKKRGN